MNIYEKIEVLIQVGEIEVEALVTASELKGVINYNPGWEVKIEDDFTFGFENPFISIRDGDGKTQVLTTPDMTIEHLCQIRDYLISDAP